MTWDTGSNHHIDHIDSVESALEERRLQDLVQQAAETDMVGRRVAIGQVGALVSYPDPCWSQLWHCRSRRTKSKSGTKQVATFQKQLQTELLHRLDLA